MCPPYLLIDLMSQQNKKKKKQMLCDDQEIFVCAVVASGKSCTCRAPPDSDRQPKKGGSGSLFLFLSFCRALLLIIAVPCLCVCVCNRQRIGSGAEESRFSLPELILSRFYDDDDNSNFICVRLLFASLCALFLRC